MIKFNISIIFQLSCSNYPFVSYTLNPDGSSCITSSCTRSEEIVEPLQQRFRRLLQDVEVQSKAQMKEKFLADLKKLKEQLNGNDLKDALQAMRKRIDDPNVVSGDVILNMLFCFRDVQDYDAMVHLVDDLNSLSTTRKYLNSYILYWYAFALNRRKKEGDREKALKVCIQALEKVSIIKF